MPFPGIKPGSDTEKKIDRCVTQVMAKNPGWDKSRAIATCRKAIEKKEGAMPKTKNGMTARQRRKKEARQMAQTPVAQQLADDPMADLKADDGLEMDEFDKFLKEHPEYLEEVMEEISIDEKEDPDDNDEIDLEEIDEEILEEIEDEPQKELSIRANLTLYVQDSEDGGDEMGDAEMDEEDKDCDCVEISEKDLEEAELEMWKTIGGDVGLLEQLITKAKLSSTARNALPDSAFACVMDGERHLPIHDKAHVRNALARLPQMIKKGGKSAKVARCGRAKVMAAAKKMGIGKAGKDCINSILVEKDANENYRWVGWVSNNFRDRENEIITEAAHKEFIQYLDENPQMAPEFWTWHTKGTARQSKADAWLYHEGFVIMSGPLTDIEAYRLMKAISTDEIGMSHGFIAWRSPEDPTLITKYRSYEVSDLPLKHAANPWTTIDAVIKEVSSMSNEKLEYLKRLLPDGFVDGLLADAEENKSVLTALGVGSKEVDEPETEPIETEEVDEEEGKELTPEMKKALGEYLGEDIGEIKQFMGSIKELIPAMAEKIVSLDKQVKLSADEQDDKLASMIESNFSKRTKALSSRPSEDADNVITKDAADDEFPPPRVTDAGKMWLSELSGSEPVYPEDAKQ